MTLNTIIDEDLIFNSRNCVVIFISKYSKRNLEDGSLKFRKIFVFGNKKET
jgi:hypothetical protein